MIDYGLQRSRFSSATRLAILLMLCGFGIIIGSFVNFFIAQSYLHVPLDKLAEALKNSDNANLSRIIQVTFTFFLMALPSFVFAIIVSRKPFEFIGFNSAISGKQFFILIGIVVAGLYASAALGKLNEMIPLSKTSEDYFKGLENEYNKEMMAIADMKSIGDYLISLFIIALLPALFEEMLFRGALQPIMIKITRNSFAGIFITSILFSAVHMSFYGFLPRLALGMIIGYVYFFSQNLWLSSITHFLYNAYGVSQLYALSLHGKLTPEAMNDDTSSPLSYGFFAILILAGLFVFFKRESEVEISMYNHRNNRL